MKNNQRYNSDVTDEQWEYLKDYIPPAKRGGGKRRVDMRQVMNAILYVTRTGCQWSMLPSDFPPKSTVHWYFMKWNEAGIWDRIRHSLLMDVREESGREASPSAAIIDSQSVKTTEKGGRGVLMLAKK